MLLKKLKFLFGRVENNLGIGESAGYHRFLLFPNMFSKGSFFRVVNSRKCVVKREENHIARIYLIHLSGTNVFILHIIDPGNFTATFNLFLNALFINAVYYISSSEIVEFPSVINSDIITSDDINFHFHP